jgi:uncharacterized protein (TIGR02001 family)
MMKKPFQNFAIKTVVVITTAIAFGLFSPSAQAQEEKKPVASFHMTGDLVLMSNYIERGLTQTNKDPALQGAVSFNFGPQFKMGLWGSNVNFQSSEHFLLKAEAELMVPISPTTEVDFGYHNNKYFKTDTRDGSTMYLKILYSQFRFQYTSESNWEGTGDAATAYSFGMISDINANWKWDNEVGYSMLTTRNFANYFDVRTSALYRGSNSIDYNISLSATSDPGQFNGQGDIAVFVGASRAF